MKKAVHTTTHGFTLIELLIVIVLIGILTSIGIFAFMSSQRKSRDSRRKADLSSITKALEMYNNDVGTYPAASAGLIVGCGDLVKTACSWGTSFANTTKATYMVKLPVEPTEGHTYYYEKVGNNGYRLYARLENLEDLSVPTTGTKEYAVLCATSIYCNYVVSSPNVADPSLRP